MPPRARNNGIQLRTDESRKGESYSLGVELAAGQLRVGVLAKGARPSSAPMHAFERTGFYAVGRQEWRFEPQKAGSAYEVPADKVDAVSDFVRDLLRKLDIDPGKIERIGVGIIVTYNDEADAVQVDGDAVVGRLIAEFGDIDIAAQNRTRASLHAESLYGAGAEIKPSNRLMYLTLSKNLNLDIPGDLAADGIFARGIWHSPVDRALLEQLGKELLDSTYVAPSSWTCATCRNRDCLYRIASGQGILENYLEHVGAGQAATAPAASIVAARAAQSVPFVLDRGAYTLADGTTPIDSAAIIRAADYNPLCRQVVLQAGIALGISLVQTVIRPGLFDPQLIVVGGTVASSTRDGDGKPATIDGILLRTLHRLLPQDRHQRLLVTRSRFAGFTAPLGLALGEGQGEAVA